MLAVSTTFPTRIEPPRTASLGNHKVSARSLPRNISGLRVDCIQRTSKPQKEKRRRSSKSKLHGDEYYNDKKANTRSPRGDVKGAKDTKKKSHKYVPVVFFRRSDLKYLKPPPWTLYSHCSLGQLDLHDLIKPSSEGEAGNPRTNYIPAIDPNRGPADKPSEEEAALHDVNVRMELTPAGENYYLRGEVRATTWACCDRCGEDFTQTLESELDLWLASTANPYSEDPNEVYMPPGTNVVDLTATVRDIVSLSVPSKIICASPSCADPSSRSWRIEAPPSDDDQQVDNIRRFNTL